MRPGSFFCFSVRPDNIYRLSVQVKNRILLPVSFMILKWNRFRQYKERLLATWFCLEDRSWLDAFLFDPVFYAWIKYEYLPEPDPDKREALKHLAMGGRSGYNWARYYDACHANYIATIGDLPFDTAIPIFSGITDVLIEKSRATVVQIGCSSGHEIACLAARFPAVRFIGTDIYPEVIDYAASHHKDQNLYFRLVSAKDIGLLLRELPGEDIVIMSSGSLQYVQPEHLTVFFQAVKAARAEVLILEPGACDGTPPDELQGSIYRDNFSITHNYRYYAERAGLRTISSKIIYPYSRSSPHQGVIHLFYHGAADIEMPPNVLLPAL